MKEIVVRQQRAKRGKRGFAGPDCYVAVVTRPDGSEPVGRRALSKANARKFGWEIRRLGEGYGRHSGPKSTLGRLLEEARKEVEG